MNLNDDEGLELHAESELPGERWFPSNGTAGDVIHSICEDCQRDKAMNGAKPFDDCGTEDLCDILGRSYSDSESVVEWRRLPDGEIKCMAFLPMDAPAPRCDKTLELF